jgi:polyferredoxin
MEEKQDRVTMSERMAPWAMATLGIAMIAVLLDIWRQVVADILDPYTLLTTGLLSAIVIYLSARSLLLSYAWRKEVTEELQRGSK